MFEQCRKKKKKMTKKNENDSIDFYEDGIFAFVER